MALDDEAGQITPQQIDQALPAMPWESPLPFVPRFLAQRLWPRGFLPLQPAPMPAPPVPPAGTAQAPPGLPPPPQPRAVAPPPPPAPVRSVRRPVAERRGM
ncbi:hypothetical protein ES703_55793 [subsurface metagenome]